MMNFEDYKAARSSLIAYYKDEINETQFYWRMNAAGFSQEQSNDLFDKFCEIVYEESSKNKKIASFCVLAFISTLILTFILSLLT